MIYIVSEGLNKGKLHVCMKRQVTCRHVVYEAASYVWSGKLQVVTCVWSGMLQVDTRIWSGNYKSSRVYETARYTTNACMKRQVTRRHVCMKCCWKQFILNCFLTSFDQVRFIIRVIATVSLLHEHIVVGKTVDLNQEWGTSGLCTYLFTNHFTCPCQGNRREVCQ